MSNSKKLITLRKLSDDYSIPLSTARRWASERRFPIVKLSNRVFVRPEKFEEWLESNCEVDTKTKQVEI